MDAKLSFPSKEKPFCDILPGQELYCKNGETVIVRNIINDDIIVEYKKHYYQRNLPDCFNRTLFIMPYNPTAHYYDYYGYDDDGFDQNGFDREGFNRNGFTRDGFDRNGYSINGYDRYGYDKNGYDRSGYNKLGYNRSGYDRNGFDKDGYDRYGFDASGFDEEGYNREGFDKEGIDRCGWSWIDKAKQLGENEKKEIFGRLCCNTGIVKRCESCERYFIIPFNKAEFCLKKKKKLPKSCKDCHDKYLVDHEKYAGLRSTMQRDAPRRQTGRQIAYIHSQPFDE